MNKEKFIANKKEFTYIGNIKKIKIKKNIKK